MAASRQERLTRAILRSLERLGCENLERVMVGIVRLQRARGIARQADRGPFDDYVPVEEAAER